MTDLPTMLIRCEEKLDPENTKGYGLLPIPCALDEEISKLISEYLKSTNDERSFIRNTFTDRHSFTFLAFSERMACLAVRKKLGGYIFEGLIAHAIEGGKFDWRENILVLSLLHHSAVKIGVNPAKLFNRAANYAENEIKKIIRSFPSRDPKDMSIKTMGYIESENADGFCYKRTW